MGVWVRPLNFRGCDQEETLLGTLPVPTVTMEAGFTCPLKFPHLGACMYFAHFSLLL